MRPYNTVSTYYVDKNAPRDMTGQSPTSKPNGDGPFASIESALVAVAVLCIGLGIAQEQPNAVLQKAIRICLECIGIG